MQKKNKTILLTAIFAICLLFATNVFAKTISNKLSGRILLSVEDRGQAWYVEPNSLERIFLGRPNDAFKVMQEFGLGITEKDYNNFTKLVPEKLAGKILLRVESKGEAYFVNPLNLKLYYLGRPSDAFSLMRNLGLGISKQNLAEIKIKENFSEIFYNEEDNNNEIIVGMSESENIVEQIEEDVANDSKKTVEEEISDPIDLVLRDLELGEMKKIKKTTVKSSFPKVVVEDSYALLWWDGFASFSSFNPQTMTLDRTHNFNGSNPGDIAKNNTSHAIAWEKNCRVYVDVVNELGNSLSESKAVASRVDEGCPMNIRLSSDANNFALLWTQNKINEKANMYLKIFTPKAISINSEILISDTVDVSIEPSIVWSGDAYIVVWQEAVDDRKIVYMSTFDTSGKQIDTKKELINDIHPISNLELFETDGIYKIFWLENNVETFVKSISFDVEQVDLPEINMTSIQMLVEEESVLSVAENNDKYGISWKSDDEQIYFMEINSDNNQVSSINLISSENTESTQADLFVIDSSYAIFWQANDNFSKAIYFRKIK